MSNTEGPWVIFDARAVMHHCFNMGKDPERIIGEDGELYNTAEFAFRNFLTRYMDAALEIVSPTNLLIAMDGGIEYRRSLHPDYKKKREIAKGTTDPVKVEQSAKFYNAMQGFWAAIGCTVGRVKGVEADDLIAYWCDNLPGKKMVYTTDGDLVALSSEDVIVQLKLEAFMGDMFKFSGGPAEGVPPNKLTLCKSLLGDTSDQYGGIKGFGPKKWTELVEAFGYDGMDEIENCIKTRDFSALHEALECCPDNQPLKIIINDLDNWALQYELAKLQPKLCTGTKDKKLVTIDWFRRIPDVKRLTKVLTGMNALEKIGAYEELCVQVWLLDSENIEDGDIDEALAAFAKSPCVGFDYETQDAHYETLNKAAAKGNYVDIMTSQIAGASFCFGENNQYCFYIPVNHKDSNNLSKTVIQDLLDDMPHEHTKFVVHNNAFEGAVTKLQLNTVLDYPVYDTAIMSSYVDENESSGLKSLSKENFNYTQETYAEVVGDRLGMFECTADEVVSYGCDDSIVTAHLYSFFKLRMMLEGTWDFYEENEPYVQNPLTDAFINGTNMDWDRLAEIYERDKKIIIEKTAFVRRQLEENCAERNEAGALGYIAADGQNTHVLARRKATKAFGKLVEKGDQVAADEEKWVEDRVISDMNKFREKARAGSQYIPYKETVVMPKFIPTVKNFNVVVEAIGITTPIESVAKSRISGWAAEVNAYDFDDIDAEPVVLTAQQKEFIELLMGALPELKAREGEEYEKLSEFCGQFMGEGTITSTGTELNMGSASQMQLVMYAMMGLPTRLRSKVTFGSGRQKYNLEGSPGTDGLAVDTALANDVPKTDWRYETLLAIKECKESMTRCSMYHTKYPLWKHPDDGRMHPQIRNCGTVTRRPSGTSPNILAVSKHQIDADMRGVYLAHSEKFEPCKNIWVPYEEPRVIVAPDFSQQELRILASECGDETMMSAYIGDDRKDIHSLTGSGIAGMPYADYEAIIEDKTHPLYAEMQMIRKRPAKQTNFLIAYLGTAFTLAQRLIIPQPEAEVFMDRTFALYPGIKPWQEAMGDYGRKHGYTVTAYGNRRHLSSRIFSTDNSVRRRMERQAANAVIQGTAADILKIVLAQVDKTKLMEQTKSILLAPIYDEVASTVPVSKAITYTNRLIDIMELTPPGHAIPMEADVSIGPDWQRLDEIGVRPSDDAIMASCEKAIKHQEARAKLRAA